jgi:hypothetical protein
MSSEELVDHRHTQPSGHLLDHLESTGSFSLCMLVKAKSEIMERRSICFCETVKDGVTGLNSISGASER